MIDRIKLRVKIIETLYVFVLSKLDKTHKIMQLRNENCNEIQYNKCIINVISSELAETG